MTLRIESENPKKKIGDVLKASQDKMKKDICVIPDPGPQDTTGNNRSQQVYNNIKQQQNTINNIKQQQNITNNIKQQQIITNVM